ncbi:MAG: hypothetical protein LBF93_06675 [Zoogloeaceae bacterium]|jgi:hypothetical protein|nr:hypothetical protein [Zoogloeaceae bacterium]
MNGAPDTRQGELLPGGDDRQGALVWPRVDRELLAVLRAVVRALGLVRAREWLAAFGGVSLAIPARKSHWAGLAPEEVERLREALALHADALGRVALPKPDKLLTRHRDALIRRDRAHMSLSALAHAYRLTSRHIQNICRRMEDNSQGDLF